MDVVIRSGPNPETQKFIGWQGEAVGVSGQFIAVRLTHDPRGNIVAPDKVMFYEPMELECPVDWSMERKKKVDVDS